MNLIEQELKKFEHYLSVNKRNDISIKTIEQQLKLFGTGTKIPKLIKPCTMEDGIVQLQKNHFPELLKEYNTASLNGRITKFVPASGAASRMFQKLQSVLNRFTNFSLQELKNFSKNDKEYKSVYDFLSNLKKFAFYEDVKSVLNKNDIEVQKLITDEPAQILKTVLFEPGLNYLSKPKGAIKFHRYDNECRTAFEEQIYESLQYVADKNNKLKIHFTISQEHTEIFEDIIAQLINKLNKTNFKVEITYSYQKKSTDTIAVDINNQIIYDKDNNIVQRPAGHGALLENLNDLNGDIVIIKNIDNLSIENLAAETILYKKLLTGFLVKIQNRTFNFLRALELNGINKKDFNDILLFAEQNLFITKSPDFENWSDERKSKYLFDKLNRPIRICGMVKNEGEPGGGPFWIKSDDGSVSLQIIEQVQINMNNENQTSIFKKSTHFNPVDIVCGVKDYKGKNFDLMKFRDPESGIITKKSKDGIELKALELPGLWNGSMAYWNTIFVEVPISTFNPVKEVNDLLKSAHQS